MYLNAKIQNIFEKKRKKPKNFEKNIYLCIKFE